MSEKILLDENDNVLLDTNNIAFSASFSEGGGAVDSVNGKTGDVVLDADDLSDATTTNKFVTAAEKTTWNNKSDFSGDYNDLVNKPVIPSKTSDITNDSGFITESALAGYQEELTTSSVDDGTVDKAIGFDSNGNLVKGPVSSGGGSTVVAIQNLVVDPENPNKYTGNITAADLAALEADDTSCITATIDGEKIVLQKTATGVSGELIFVAVNLDNTTVGGATAQIENTNVELNLVGLSLAAVATSGNYDDLNNKPTLFSGSYNDLMDKPTLFSGDYNDLTNKPTLANVATSGSYNDLADKPDLSVYAETNDLANVATSGDYNDLTNKPTLFDGNYNSLTNKPDLSIYAQSSALANVATSGSYNDLSNKPTIPEVPTNVSAFNNDAEYITSADIPTDVSDFNNDAGYITDSALTGYATEAYVQTAIEALPEPMVFKGSVGQGGTIENLPNASGSNKGHTYIVITAGTYAGQTAEVGDTFISTGSAWTLIPSGDEPEGTVTSVGISVPTGLEAAGGPITSSGTIAITYANGYAIPTTAKQAEWDAKSDFSGSYSDLINKPDLSVYAESASLATVATSGSYNDLGDKPTIPATAADVHALPDSTTYVASIGGANGAITLGSNLSLSNGELSATDTTYTNGTGINLSGTTFSIDTAVVATQTDLSDGLATKQNKIQIIDLT